MARWHLLAMRLKVHEKYIIVIHSWIMDGMYMRCNASMHVILMSDYLFSVVVSSLTFI